MLVSSSSTARIILIPGRDDEGFSWRRRPASDFCDFHTAQHRRRNAGATLHFTRLFQEGGPDSSGWGAGDIMPCAATRSRAGPRMDGHLRANAMPPRQLIRPPIATVTGAPMRSAKAPARSDPIGDMPRNII